MRIRVIREAIVPGIGEFPNGIHQFIVGNLAYHIAAGDGFFVYTPNDDYSVCTGIALCEVIDTSPQLGECTLNIHRSTHSIEPFRQRRHLWRENPYLCLDKKVVDRYGLVEIFSETFCDPTWRQRKIEDAVGRVFRPDLSLPTLRPIDGYVYILKATEFYKIGKATIVERRKGQVEKAVDEELELVHQFHSNDHTRSEIELHQKYAHCRKHGEWFDLSTHELLEICGIKEVLYLES